MAGSLHFGMSMTRKSHQGLRQQQQINFAERTVLKDSLQESSLFKKIDVSSFWSYGKLFIFKIPASGTDFQNTGLLPASAKLAVKYRPGRWNTGHLATPFMTTPSSAESCYLTCVASALFYCCLFLRNNMATNPKGLLQVTIVTAYFRAWLLTSNIFSRWCSETVTADNGKAYVSYNVKSSRGESVAMLPQVWKIHYSARLWPMCLSEEVKLRLCRLLFTQYKTTWLGNTSVKGLSEFVFVVKAWFWLISEY